MLFQSRQHHITLLSSNVEPELQQHSQVTWIDISVKRWPTQLISNLIFSWRSTVWLQKHRADFDLVQAYGTVTAAATDVNTVQFVHSGWLRSPVHPWRLRRDIYGAYQWLYNALNAYWEKKTLCQAKIVVAVSQKIKQELIDLGVPKERIQVILNGVDLQEFFSEYVDRDQLGLPEKVTLALFVGDIRTPRKNLATVLNALPQVPDLHLVVVGATERSPYPELAVKLGLDNRVHFLGYRRDVSKIMKAVDLFVFPSRYEPFGMVVSEAMASGLPIITTVTTGAAEIVTREGGIILSDSEDVQALTEALGKLASDRELRQQMGKVGRAIAQQHSWDSKTKSYLDLFEDICKS